MRHLGFARATCVRALGVLAFVAALSSFGAASRAEPLLTRGIGTASCDKLLPDLKPNEGLNHPPNYLLYYWVQGYISAANIFLLNEYTNFIDMNEVSETVILDLVYDFCKNNPGKTPISAIDKFIRETKKVEAKEDLVFDPWEQ